MFFPSRLRIGLDGGAKSFFFSLWPVFSLDSLFFILFRCLSSCSAIVYCFFYNGVCFLVGARVSCPPPYGEQDAERDRTNKDK